MNCLGHAHSVVEPRRLAKTYRGRDRDRLCARHRWSRCVDRDDRLQVASGLDQLSAEGVSSSPRSKVMSICSRCVPGRPPNSSRPCRPPRLVRQLVRSHNMVIAGPSKYFRASSIRSSSGLARPFSRSSGTLSGLCVFALSRCRSQDDLLFFILSTRMMPPIAVAIPIYLMYRELGLTDTISA